MTEVFLFDGGFILWDFSCIVRHGIWECVFVFMDFCHSGIGRATALALAHCGAKVIAVTRSQADLNSLVHEVTPPPTSESQPPVPDLCPSVVCVCPIVLSFLPFSYLCQALFFITGCYGQYFFIIIFTKQHNSFISKFEWLFPRTLGWHASTCITKSAFTHASSPCYTIFSDPSSNSFSFCPVRHLWVFLICWMHFSLLDDKHNKYWTD